MRNERGLTLIEVMATLTISAVLLGVVMLLLSSTNMLSRNNSDKYNADAEIRNTMDRLAKEISDSNDGYLTGSEFRYVTFVSGTAERKSLYFDSQANTLTLYDFGASHLTENVTLNTPGVYSNPIVLSTHLDLLQYLPYGSEVEIPTNTNFGYQSGEISIFRMKFNFEFPEATLNGGTRNKSVTRETGFKILQY